MSVHTAHPFDSDADRTPIRPGQLSSNGHWVFGSIFAGLILIGFSFGVWAGAPPKPKAVETAEAKPKEPEKVAPKPVAPAVVAPQPEATKPEPVKPEPSDPMPVKPEPVKPEPPKPEPPKPEPPKPEPPKPEVKKDPPKPPAKAVAFKEVLPVLRTYCGNCHGLAGKPKDGVDIRTVASIMKGGDGGAIVKPGDPDKSPLYESIKAGRMPPDGKPAPSEKELALIRDWILSGAKERRRTVRRRGGRGRWVELTPPTEPG